MASAKFRTTAKRIHQARRRRQTGRTRLPPPERRSTRGRGQFRLEEELRRLHALGFGLALSAVRWIPGGRTDVEAEVADSVIIVYVVEHQAAIHAVRHEIFDYELSMCCRPYVALVNALLAVTNEDAYRAKERLAEALGQLLATERAAGSS